MKVNLDKVTPLAEKIFNTLIRKGMNETNTRTYEPIFNRPETDPEVILVASEVLKNEN
jgi:hypothetical protein